jgi:hypothetical protein
MYGSLPDSPDRPDEDPHPNPASEPPSKRLTDSPHQHSTRRRKRVMDGSVSESVKAVYLRSGTVRDLRVVER